MKNNKDLYNKVGKEIGWDFSKMNYTKDVVSDFNYFKALNKYIDEKKIVLDVGCGSAGKTIENITAKKVYGIDTEKEMLKKAAENLKKHPSKVSMFEFMVMDGFKHLNFKDEYFDVVISRHCGINVNELKRVLRKDGVFISEDIDKYDCWNLKTMFQRGQNYFNDKPLSETAYKKLLDLGFSRVEKFDIVEIEYYKSYEDLLYLLTRTPIITNFGKFKKDFDILEKYIKINSTNRGIKLERKLFGIIATK